MQHELDLRFANAEQVIVSHDGDESGSLPFANPLSDKELTDIQWYAETYASNSVGDPDDFEAARISGQLAAWGQALFSAVFSTRAATRLFDDFQKKTGATRLLTISTEHADILALPWELLHDPAPGGGFLFLETPRISIRRRVAGATGGRGSFKTTAKNQLHLLMVVCRPDDAGFLDPRSDAMSVLDAIDAQAPGRVACEFLRPPTLAALLERLESEPQVDIVHFDGHGVFDRQGGLPRRAGGRAREDMRTPAAAGAACEDPDFPPNTGYLLFEDREGSCDFVTAQKLGANLQRHHVSLVILSACQSAAIQRSNGSEEAAGDTAAAEGPAMGCVAARLTATGIPSVLAMTHSVLAATTRSLFGQFYEELARNRSIGESLDNARRCLHNQPERFEVQRGPTRVPLKLHDWFLPALYQQGTDGVLLRKPKAGAPPAARPALRSNLPAMPESGFFGRRRALWAIERWFAGATRRITITGFGGQGKTALAQEAGRWLLRTGLFDAAVFVDYARVQAGDAVAAAVASMAVVLGESLVDAESATAALGATRTLVILDNLEALEPPALQALLAAAVPWSTAGGSRLLCTTRRPRFDHRDYKVEGTHLHRAIALDGLGDVHAPEDALAWCSALMKLPPVPVTPPPKREALIALFEQVSFHPLSIRVLAQQLKVRRPADLGERLRELLTDAQPQGEDTPASLLASIELSLDRLDSAARAALPLLGVFRGGAFEDDLTHILGFSGHERLQAHERFLAAAELGDIQGLKPILDSQGAWLNTPSRIQEIKDLLPWVIKKLRASIARMKASSPELWRSMRRQLESAALIQAEPMSHSQAPYLRFHPTLGPMLWAALGSSERDELTAAHRERYSQVVKELVARDVQTPQAAREIALCDISNWIHAAHGALACKAPYAVQFADNLSTFLVLFNMRRQAQELGDAAQAAVEHGTDDWAKAEALLANRHYESGHFGEAAAIHNRILQSLGTAPSHSRAMHLVLLGRCLRSTGRPDLALRYCIDALAICDELGDSSENKRLRSTCLSDMATALRQSGQLAHAKQAYAAALEIDIELRDFRGQAIINTQLGTVSMVERDLDDAAKRFREAIELSRSLLEAKLEASAWHQLGVVYQIAEKWEEAETYLRKAASMKEELGMLFSATTSWNSLATVIQNSGRPEAAEKWYRKSMAVLEEAGHATMLASVQSNIATLIYKQPGRLAEAFALASAALEVKKTVDPGSAEIWLTYSVLAKILESQAAAATDAGQRNDLRSRARDMRLQGRRAYAAFPGSARFLDERRGLVEALAGIVKDTERWRELEAALEQMHGDESLQTLAAFRSLAAGERDLDNLTDHLNPSSSLLMQAVLERLQSDADPQ